jgi:short-subunit dehydrogenase
MTPTSESGHDGQVWFVTGATHGMGAEFARTALDATTRGETDLVERHGEYRTGG